MRLASIKSEKEQRALEVELRRFKGKNLNNIDILASKAVSVLFKQKF